MSTPCCAIDVHTHVVPAHLPDERPEFAGLPWPSIKHTEACHAQVIISGKNYRAITDACWDVPRRIADMLTYSAFWASKPKLTSFWSSMVSVPQPS